MNKSRYIRSMRTLPGRILVLLPLIISIVIIGFVLARNHSLSLRCSRVQAQTTGSGGSTSIKGDFHFPVACNVLRPEGHPKVISHWGDKRPGGRLHKGVDISGVKGGSYAVSYCHGIVRKVDTRSMPGHYIRIRCNDGYDTLYMHLDQSSHLKKGDFVKAGQVIGFVGKSGNARRTAPHLHFEIRNFKGTPRDPEPYVPFTLPHPCPEDEAQEE